MRTVVVRGLDVARCSLGVGGCSLACNLVLLEGTNVFASTNHNIQKPPRATTDALDGHEDARRSTGRPTLDGAPHDRTRTRP